MRYPKTAGFGKSMGFPAEEKIDRAYFMVFLSYGNSLPYRKERFFEKNLRKFKKPLDKWTFLWYNI